MVFAFIYLPIVVLVVYSFNRDGVGGFPPRHFTLEWYRQLFADSAIWDSVLNSLLVAAGAVALALTLGLLAALALHRANFPGKELFRRLVLLPLILPGIITGVALLSFFSLVHLSLSSGYPVVPGWPVVLGHGAAVTPVVTTQVFARLQRFDRALEEASLDLYADEWRTFRYVTLPTIRSAVLGSALLVFTLSLDEIAVTFFLVGRQNTLPLQLWGLLRRGITPEVNAAASVIFVVSVAVIVLAARAMRENPH